MACAVLVAACRPEPPPTAPLPASTPTQRPQTPLLACGGGQLCEARAPFGPWRIPAGCRPLHTGRYLATCWLPVTDWNKVQEFFVTRYPATDRGPDQLTVTAAVQATRNASPTPARLQVLRRLEGVEIRSLAGDAPTVDAAAPLP